MTARYEGSTKTATTTACESDHNEKRKYEELNYNNSPADTLSSRGRAGKWTPEEEVYAEYLTSLFLQGVLPDCDVHVTLRAYLAEKLNCKPMRVTKKYTSSSYDGKIMYTPCGNVLPNMAKLTTCRANYLQSLQRPKNKRVHKKKQRLVREDYAPTTGSIGTSSGGQQEDSDLPSVGGCSSIDPLEYFQIDNNIVGGQITPGGMEILKDALRR